MDAVSICVPTPLRQTGDPDMSFIISATEQLAKYMHKGMVVVLESTTYPGTTRELLLPKLSAGGTLKIGQDWFLAFSPERVDPGREDFTTLNTPKVVGGITPACSEVAAAWYGGALQHIHPVSSAEAAEMAKLLENTFRMINIGLVNEMAIMCDRLGVDVWEVIDAAATKPFGFMKFTPGPGLGGHCIPIDPLYLSWKMKSFNYNARFIDLASEINTNMPRYVVGRVLDAMNDRGLLLKGARVLVLGAAYKPDIDDVRESPALDVIGLLRQKGAQVEYHDPYIPHIHHEKEGWHMDSIADVMAGVGRADAVVIVTDHKVYDYEAILTSAKFVFDTRNATGKQGKGNPKVVRL
jgi:UDP-N-acetyl-D-glucosamine dehydrogenase